MHRQIMLAGAAALATALGGPSIRTHEHGRAPPRHATRLAMPDAPPTNGKREVARRLRQIERGQLKVTA